MKKNEPAVSDASLETQSREGPRAGAGVGVSLSLFMICFTFSPRAFEPIGNASHQCRGRESGEIMGFLHAFNRFIQMENRKPLNDRVECQKMFENESAHHFCL